MKRTPILVENGRVEISVGDAHASAPVALLEPLLALLEASIAVVKAEASPTKRSPRPSADPVASAAPTPKRAPLKQARPAAGAKKYQRKSRKPVAPSLIAWLERNPGWHHEEELLAAVVQHNMTDADPKRALMIALGKARDKTFSTDGSGHWKLLADAAGPPPLPKKSVKGKAKKNAKSAAASKRKSAAKTRKAAKAKKSDKGADGRGRKKLGTQLVDWMEMHTGWQPFDELLAAVIENEMTDADPSLALKITLGKGLGRGHFETDGNQNWKLVGDGTAEAPEAPKAVLRKRSDKGKAAPAERWTKADDDTVTRARHNLLGLGRAGG